MRTLKGLVIISLFLMGGCSSTEAIYKNYNNLDLKAGVKEHEAKIIAQRIIISTSEARNYRITAPDIKTIQQALKYPDFWFVIFGHNWFSPVSSEPLAKTYTELREAEFLVVIDKNNGHIKFSGLWYPKRENDFDWVFDLGGYKRNDPLALPPYTEIKGRVN